MRLPDRESLLDVEWLKRRHAAEPDVLCGLVVDAAGVYGGAVTGVAEALRDIMWPSSRQLLWIELRHGLAHALTTGSWSTSPTGGRTFYSCHQWLRPALRRARPDLAEKSPGRFEITCVPPPLPDLATLRLAPPLDMAWVNPHYGVWGCGVSPDGRYVVSASRGGDDSGGYLLLWDADAGTRIASVFHSHELRDCAVSPDGRHLISQDGAGTVALRALPALTLEGTIEQLAFEHRPTRGSTRGSQRRWRRFAVSADGGRIAVAGFGTVRIFRLAPFAFDGSVKDLGTLSQGIVALGFDADRLIIVGRGEPMPVLVWDANLRRIVERCELQVPDIDGISRAVVAADKRLLIAAGDDAMVVWTLDQSSPVGMIPGGIPGQALAVSADATMAATSGPERYDAERAISLVGQTIRLWSLPDLRRIASWTLAHLGCRDIVTGLAFSADNRHLVLAGWEGVVRRLAIG